MSSIVARQHRIHVGQSPFAHNFLVLLDDDGNRVSELHGLPVSAEGEVLDKGSSSEWLRAFEYLAREKPEPRLDHAPNRFSGKGHAMRRSLSGRPLRKRMTRSTVGT